MGEKAKTERFKGTWLGSFVKDYKTDSAFYCISFYWTITTITTVGYGDILADNIFEMIFSSVMMLIGVVSFAFATGSLASIISNKDSDNGRYQEKLVILENAKKKFPIPEILYRKMKKSINYKLQNEHEALNNFVNELPNHL